MSGNVWRVKHEWYPFDEPHRVWEIQTLVDGWWETVDYEMSWQAAQNETDRLARTVQITLPRVGRQAQIPVPEDYRNERPISVSNHVDFIGATFTAQGLTQDVAIHPEEAEPLALTLLAMHHQRKEQQ